MMSKCREWNLAGLIAILLFMQVDTLSLTSTQLPDEGFVQFKYGGSNNKVCWSTLKQRATFVICRQLGYQKDRSIVKKSTPSGNKVGIFTGNIQCAGQEKSLSQCSIKTTGRKAKSCKFLSYLRCAICPRPQLVEHKNRFPDSSFTAPNSITSSPSNARRDSGSSWCAPVADGKHYLQLDLGRVYVIYKVATFGDSNSAKWVTTYQLNYTVDMINWENAMGKNITGNKQAYSDASITVLGAKIIRAFRFIPLAYVGQPCMRIEVCGGTRYPDKPTGLTVTKIKSGSAEISWVNPKDTGDYKAGLAPLTGFLIKLKKGNCLVVNTTVKKFNKWKLTSLDSHTTYEVSVAAGNIRGGFGQATTTSFRTAKIIITSGTTIVRGVSLSNSTLPNEGFVQIKYGGTKNVCWQSLKNKANNVLCRQLGYTKEVSLVEKPIPANSNDSVFSGSINCNGKEKTLSQCSVTNSEKTCSQLSYIKCFVCNNPLLENKQKFQDSSFTASASSEGHSPSDARISSGSSWCAPVADGKQYLQVDLKRLYVISNIVTFAGSTCFKWVTSYNLNYTVDGINWKRMGKKRLPGNKNAYDARRTHINKGLTTRALRFIPITYVGQPCMRIQICGATRFLDKPTNLTVTNIKSRSAEISWTDPKNAGDKKILTRFLIQLIKDNFVIRNITTAKANKRKIRNLTPNTTYQISIAAGNRNGFSDKTTTSFTTLAKVSLPNKPSKVRVTNITSESAGISWKDPVNRRKSGLRRYWIKLMKKNNVILNITIHKVNKYEIDNLFANTTYQISVAAGNQDGFGKETIRSFKTHPKASLPDKPTNLTVTNIKSRNAEISWTEPKNVEDKKILTRFLIQLIKDNSVIRNITTAKVNKRKLRNLTPNTTYQISIAAGNRNGFSEKTTTSFTTLAKVSLPNKPSKLRVTNITSESAGISWKDPVNEGKDSLRRYWIKLTKKNNVILNITINKVNKYEIDNLFANTTYQISVAAGNRDGFGKETIRSFKTHPKASLPDKPTNLTVTNIKSRRAEISWTEPKNVEDKKILTRFRIQLIKDNTVIRNITTAKVNKRKLRNLTPNTTYQISIAAGNRNGFSEKTTSFTTLAKVPLPNKLSKLRVTNITSESAGISWKDPVNEGKDSLTRYWIKLTKKNNVILNITIHKVNKYEIDNLFANTTYQISVAAGNRDGFGKETIRSFTTHPKASLPDKPTNLTVTNIKSRNAKISWTDPKNVGDKKILTRFLIQLIKDNSVIRNITTGKMNKRKLRNLTPNTTYEISIAAGNRNGFGKKTTTSFTTLAKVSLPNKLSKLRVTNITSESARISWKDPVNERKNDLTRYWIRLTKKNTLILNITVNKINKYEVNHLFANTRYQISVAAGNQNGFGKETIRSFTTRAKASLPDKPSKLTVGSVTSESAKISWENPANKGKNGLTGFWIKLTKDGTLILNITIKKVNKYEINYLFANTTYQISVAAGNQDGFGEETIITFTTPAEASLPKKPSKLTVTSITPHSAGISWVDPVNDGKSGLIGFWIKLIKNNTLILNITINKVNKYTIYNLASNTTYEIFLAAGNPNGFGEEAITSFRTTAIAAIFAKLSDTGGKQDTDNSSDGYVAGVVMLTVVLLVVLAFLGYIIYRYRQFKSAIAEHFGEETSAKMTAILTGKQQLESVISGNLGEQTSAEITALLSTEQRIESTTADNLENTPADVTVVLAEKDRKVSKDLNANPVQMYVPMVVFTSKGEDECLLPKGFGHYEKKDSSDIGFV